jgi:hypothetical protein
MKSKFDNVKIETILQERCLDNLAKLLQGSSPNFIATCLIDYTLIIAGDEVHGELSTENERNPRVELIQDVMKYFSDLANEYSGHKQLRAKVFKQLCSVSLNHHESNNGYNQLNNEMLDKAAEEILTFYETRDFYKIKDQKYIPLYFVQKILALDPGLQYFISVIYKTFAFIAKDFLMVEEFITISRDNQNDLMMAFKGNETKQIITNQMRDISNYHQELSQYENGFTVLYLDRPGVHAKAKIIEYLVLTKIIENVETSDKVYIGTSQPCCKICNEFANAVNKVFCSGEEVICTTKTYGIHFDWVQPMICKYNPYKEDTIKYLYHAKQLKVLTMLVPGLNRTSETHELNYQKSYAQSLVTEESLVIPITIVKDKVLVSEEENSVSEKWDNYLLIRSDLIKKGIHCENILLPVSNEAELETTLEQIKQPNSYYILLLSIDSALVEEDCWTGLFIITDHEANVSLIKYLSSTGKPINKFLTQKIWMYTGFEIQDSIVEKVIQSDLDRGGLKASAVKNDYNYRAILVELFHELVTSKDINSYSFNNQELVESSQYVHNETKMETSSIEMLMQETAVTVSLAGMNIADINATTD